MSHLLLIRHGRTGWNRVERFRGRADLPLDQVGRRQAQALARRLLSWPLAAVYSSPLRRALTTAQPIAQAQGLSLQPLGGLIDIDYGRWQGLTPEEAQAQDPDLYARWMELPQEARFPGGEGLEEVRQRALEAVVEVARRYPGEAVALVSHKVVCKVLLCALLGLDNSHFWQVEQDVAALNVIQMEGDSLRVALLNDTCHLGRPRRASPPAGRLR